MSCEEFAKLDLNVYFYLLPPPYILRPHVVEKAYYRATET